MVQKTHIKSWGQRMTDALFGIFIGVALILGSFVLTFWNEKSSIHTFKSLQEIENILVSVPISPIDGKNNLRIIYLSGLATTNDILRDPFLQISRNAIKLHRQVEIYQWQENIKTETKKQVGGIKQVTKTYKYKPTWAAKLIDSSEFNESAQHKNPSKIPIHSATDYAKNVKVGDFVIPSDLIKKIDDPTIINLNDFSSNALQSKIDKTVKHFKGEFYIGLDPRLPQIGDLKIQEYEVLPQTVSIIAQQNYDTLEPYQTQSSKIIYLLEMGVHSPQEMIANAEAENQLNTWLLRLLSLCMMIIGLAFLMQLFNIIADFIPFFRRLMSFETDAVSFFGGVLLWLLATSIAWITVRPMGLIILLFIFVTLFYLILKRKTERESLLTP